MTIEEQYREYLDTLPLTVLRYLGRLKGVPTNISAKNAVVGALIEILTGKAEPTPDRKSVV